MKFCKELSLLLNVLFRVSIKIRMMPGMPAGRQRSQAKLMPGMLMGYQRYKPGLIILSTLILLFFLAVTADCKSAFAEDVTKIKKLYYQGQAFSSQGKYDRAIKKFQEGLELSKKLKNKRFQGIFLGSMGLVYSEKSDRGNAIKYSLMALEIAQKIKDRENEAGWLGNIGSIYLKFNDLENALKYYNEALELARKLSSERNEAYLLSNMGKIYSKQGNFKKALGNFEKALEIVRKIKFKQGEMIVLENIGDTYMQTAEYPEALKYYKQLHKIALESKVKRNISASLIKIGRAYVKTAEYDEALKIFNEALSIAEHKGDKGVVLGNLGTVYVELGKYEKALVQYEKALSIARELKDRQNQGRWLTGIGVVHFQRAEYKKALEYYHRGLQLAKETGNRESETSLLGNIGGVFFQLGEYKKALEYFRKVQNLEIEPKSRIAILDNMGTVYLMMANPQSALQYYQKAYTLSKKYGNKHSEAIVLLNMGNVYNFTGKNEKAVKNYDKALFLVKKIGDKKAESEILGYTGVARFRQGKYKEALEYFDKAIAIASEYRFRYILFRLYYYKGSAYYHKKNNNKAIENLKKSIDILEDIRGALKVEELKTTFMKQYLDVYEMLIELLIKEGEVGEAFYYAERGKARNFLDMLGNRKIIPKKGADRKLAEEEGSLMVLIRSMEKARVHLKGKELKKLKKNLKEAQKRHSEIFEKLKISNPEYTALISVVPPKLEEIQSHLKPSQVILEYFVGKEKTYIWIVSKENIKCSVISCGRKKLSNAVSEIRSNIIGSKGREVSEEDLEYSRKNLADMYSLVVKPVEKYLDGKEIIVVPHSSLHYVPFSALIDGNEKYMVENYSITMEPSSSSFVHFQKRSGELPDSFVGYALGEIKKKGSQSLDNADTFRAGYSSLPGSMKELDQIKKELTDKGFNIQVYTEDEFTGKKTGETVQKGGLIHFSTHGFMSGRAKGRFSGLVVYDGYIFIIDIFNWNMNSDMVVLSACQTGMGRLLEGDEMVGLSRAFLQAGSNNLVATLWSVQDKATQILMVNFYKKILSGKSKAESLREAQLELMKKYPNPFYWAPFIIFGKG